MAAPDDDAPVLVELLLAGPTVRYWPTTGAVTVHDVEAVPLDADARRDLAAALTDGAIDEALTLARTTARSA